MEAGKEKGFVLYDEVNELLAEDFTSGREFEDLLTDLDSAGVEILEEPKIDFEKKDDADDFGDLEVAQDGGDKTNDPVRMYLRDMGTGPLLTREGEIELAKRNEPRQWAVRQPGRPAALRGGRVEAAGTRHCENPAQAGRASLRQPTDPRLAQGTPPVRPAYPAARGGMRGKLHRAAPHAADRRARRTGSGDRQEAVDRGQPAPGGFHRQALHQPRIAVPGFDPGGQHRADESRR